MDVGIVVPEKEDNKIAVTPKKEVRRTIIRRRKAKPSSNIDNDDTVNGIPSHIYNNRELQMAIAQTLPTDYDFEINKTISRIEKSLAVNVALQFPEGLTMYASAIGDILVRFAYCYQPPPLTMKEKDYSDNNEEVVPLPRKIQSLSILGDVTYGACCIDDLSAKSLGCDILVHYGHSCLVPLTRTVIPCLYVFVEIHIDVSHLVDCVRLTFRQEETERRRIRQSENDIATIEVCVMGTVQFRSAVIEAADRLNDDDISEPPHGEQQAVRFRAIVPQAKPLSPGEVLGCTSPSGLATLDIKALASAASKRRRRAKANKITEDDRTEQLAAVPDDDDENVEVGERIHERVMIFVADGRFHLEAAMISNPTLRALRYDPYSKTLTEERYETVKMKRLRRDAILETRRRLLGLSSSSSVCQWGVDGGVAGSDVPKCGDDIANHILLHSPIPLSHQSTYTDNNGGMTTTMTMGIILGTLGRQGNPAILSRVRALLRKRGIRTAIVLLSEIFPSKLEAMSAGQCGIRAWVQIACPRLSVDWGHHFTVPVLSPFELFVALGEVADSTLLTVANDGEVEKKEELTGYPMDFYSNSGGPWTNYHGENKDRKVVSYEN